MTTFTIHPEGAFSLRESAEFRFGHHVDADFDGTMRLAFCVDGYTSQAGVAVTQDQQGVVHGRIVGDADPGAVQAQVARILSLDGDARGYESVAERDPVVARVLATAPGLRPPLFHSPYEAAAWCVLSLRWGARQTAAVRGRLSRTHGREFDAAGSVVPAFPTPTALLSVDEFPGIPALKLERLHEVARAAIRGELDAGRLREAEPQEATERLREIPGIGPFSASLILLRATGVRDAPVNQELRLIELLERLYELPSPVAPGDLERIMETWRPFRTWVAVLLRGASDRILTPALSP